MRSWLPWNLDRIFSLVAEGAASSPTWCEEQEPAMEPLHEEGNTGSVGRGHGQGASGAWKPESENKTLPRRRPLPGLTTKRQDATKATRGT